MKCVYKFPVEWILKFDEVHPFSFNGFDFDFIKDTGRITHISVSVPLSASDTLPQLSKNANDPTVFDLQINEPSGKQNMLNTLRTVEGILAIYQLERIRLDETDITWVAETEDEKALLKGRPTAFNFRFGKHNKFPVPVQFPFSIVKRSVVAANDLADWQVPLGFYRKGANDFREHRYIDAIYDFYFLLETLFGNGKTKNTHVLEEFKKSPELLKLVGQVLKDGLTSVTRRSSDRPLAKVFQEKYANKSAEEYLETIVSMRGFLHHHSQRNPKIWDPAREHEYEVDALLLQDLCFKICSTKVEAVVCVPAKQGQH